MNIDTIGRTPLSEPSFFRPEFFVQIPGKLVNPNDYHYKKTEDGGFLSKVELIEEDNPRKGIADSAREFFKDYRVIGSNFAITGNMSVYFYPYPLYKAY